jgi:hypothetical protein
MRKRILLTLLLVSGFLFAQSQGFEGILRWSVTTQSIDPVTGKAMGSSRTPSQGAPDNRHAGRANMIPKEMTMKVQNKNTLIRMEGGMATMIGDILYLHDKNQTYSISREAKTYHLLTPMGERKESQPAYKVTKTTERKRVLNYDCVKYLVEMQNGPQTATQAVWASSDFKEFDAQTLSRLPIGRQGELTFLKEIEGMPMRIEMKAFGSNMVAELVEVKKQPLDASQFKIPAGYQELEMGGMGKGR